MSAILGIVAAALLASAPPAFDPPGRTLLNMRVTGGALQAYVEMGGDLGLAGDEIATVESVAQGLDPEVGQLLVTRDGWGNPLRVRANGCQSFILISFGADGEPDVPYDGQMSWKRIDPSAQRDIVWVSGMFVVRPERPADKANQASAELQKIAHAMNAYAKQNRALPATHGPVPVSEIAEQLESPLPRSDPWGQPYYVWSDGQSYLLISAGSDGQLDRAYVDADTPTSALTGPGPAANDSEDILFGNGMPARWVGTKGR